MVRQVNAKTVSNAKARGLLGTLVAIVAIVSLLALAGCAQGHDSSSADVTGPEAPVAEIDASETNANAAEPSGNTAEPSALEENADVAEASAADARSSETEASASFLISIDDLHLTVILADTEAARALVEHLQAGPVTVSLHLYGGFEQVGQIPWSLPASDEQIATSPGDIMLYQGNQITIFVGSNTWAYTPLGSIEGATPEMMLETFGGDAVDITLSLA